MLFRPKVGGLWDAGLLCNHLCVYFIHGNSRGKHAAADIGNLCQFQKSLNGAVFAPCAMQHGNCDIYRNFLYTAVDNFQQGISDGNAYNRMKSKTALTADNQKENEKEAAYVPEKNRSS